MYRNICLHRRKGTYDILYLCEQYKHIALQNKYMPITNDAWKYNSTKKKTIEM